jgi:hypothetical protein
VLAPESEGEGDIRANIKFERDSKFRIIPAVDGSIGISFQSTNCPDRFFQHRGGNVNIEPLPDNKNELDSFVWTAEKKDRGHTGNSWAFSFSSNGWYLNHSNFRVKVAKATDSDEFWRDATWMIPKAGNNKGIWAAVSEYGIERFDGETNWKFNKKIVAGMTVAKLSNYINNDSIGWQFDRQISAVTAGGMTAETLFEICGKDRINEMSRNVFKQERWVSMPNNWSGGPDTETKGPRSFLQLVMTVVIKDIVNITIKSDKVVMRED